MPIRLTEESLEQEVAVILAKELNCQHITQSSLKPGKSDIILQSDAYRFLVELKIGSSFTEFAKGVAQVSQYKSQIQADGTITLMYPSQARKVISGQQDIIDIALNLKPSAIVLTPVLNDYYPAISIIELTRLLNSHLEHATLSVSPKILINTLRDCVQTISLLLRRQKGVTHPSIEPVIGSTELFKLLAGEEKQSSPNDRRNIDIAACDLTAYIFVNQLLLYHLLSQKISRLPELNPINKIEDLMSNYKKVTDINYKAVYSINVLPILPKTTLSDVNIAIIALKAIKPEGIPHDLLGRVFHEFLPFEARKLLGAFYTKPIAADILAHLTIDRSDEICIDTACGSVVLWQ